MCGIAHVYVPFQFAKVRIFKVKISQFLVFFMNIAYVFIRIGNINFLSVKVKEGNPKKELFNTTDNLLLATN